MVVPTVLSPPEICCDIHNPDSFTLYLVVIPLQPKHVAHSRISKLTMSSLNDVALINALEDWRESTTISLHGEGFLFDLRPGLVMPTKVLDRIIACAHAHKIKTLADLHKETSWSSAELYGNQIINLILHHIPIPTVASPFMAIPLQQTVPGPTAAAGIKQRIHCSACHGEGHNGTFTSSTSLMYTFLIMFLSP
ncbi:hypothetical protein JVT61DRAFT_3205 [Boletus reticuloceps]|uniref:Uncharacterized protein n=1 Tax=Boletus reticuloceps TaxID=495285 RepID=A0A8I2YRU6_9AGAM|nr:hypothetical protein JVT61DRAFT_3205 [Boletus reticuloceps]